MSTVADAGKEVQSSPPVKSWYRNPTLILVYSTSLIFGFTAIAHENNLGATSSIIAGDSATQYGWIIALTLLGLGFGYGLSKFVPEGQEIRWFVHFEILLTLVAGFSVVIALWSYSSMGDGYIWFIRLVVLGISTLIGFEDALIFRMAHREEKQVSKSAALAFMMSNFGGGIAGFLFGGYLLPTFGVFNLPLLLGLVDGVVVLVNLLYFRKQLSHFRAKLVILVVIMISLAVTIAHEDVVAKAMTQSLYADPIEEQWVSPYGQKILTCQEKPPDCRLYINGQIQFSTKDEYIYHETLVHPALSEALRRVQTRPLNVLLIGGGDGLAARDVLKYSQVGHLTVVDLDPDMTNRVAREEPVVKFNQSSLSDPRVQVINQDASIWVREGSRELYDVVIIDLVDPDNEITAKLYSQEFYLSIQNSVLARSGIVVTQSTSPWYSPEAFWSIKLTMESVFTQVVPYQQNVPSFGQWGWQMASNMPFDPYAIEIDSSHTRWLTTQGWNASLFFGKTDWEVYERLKQQGVVSTITRPVTTFYYKQPGSWEDWGEN